MDDQLNALREKANELLRNANNEAESKKYEIIKYLLRNDDCFLNIDIEHAYAVLRDLGIDEESIASYYSSLITR